MDVIQRIKEKYDEFTNAEKKIADTILSDPKGIIESSISDLSEKAGVKSEASVVKFYKKLGLNSFQQFKVLLAQSISRAPLEIVYEDVSSEDDTKTITEKIFKATVRAILDTLNWMDVDSIEKAVDLFKNAQRIIFIGFAPRQLLRLMRFTNSQE